MSQNPSGKATSVLISSTYAFTICFAIWMMFAVIGIPIKNQLGLNETEFGLLAAMPVLSGSLVRVPLGILTDRIGGRIVMFAVMVVTIPAVYLISFATEYWQFLSLGIWLGVVGGSFSVGTPYVARWFPKEKQGFAMGVFGAGNSGAALNKFLAPALIASAGSWVVVPRVYAVMLGFTAIIFLVFSASNPKHLVSQSIPLRQQLSMLKDPRVLRYCQYYSVVFGGYVGLSLWMTKYYVNEYGLDMKHAALLAACFSLPGGVLRAMGGYLSDKIGAYRTTWWVMWVCWVSFFLLSYPQTDFTILTTKGPQTFHLHLSATLFTVLLFVVGIAMAIGKASVFKFISDEFGENIGAVSGVVGLAGGLGGFILPILFGLLVDLTGVRTSCFMLLYGTVCVSLVAMYFSFRPERAANDQEQLVARS